MDLVELEEVVDVVVLVLLVDVEVLVVDVVVSVLLVDVEVLVVDTVVLVTVVIGMVVVFAMIVAAIIEYILAKDYRLLTKPRRSSFRILRRIHASFLCSMVLSH